MSFPNAERSQRTAKRHRRRGSCIVSWMKHYNKTSMILKNNDLFNLTNSASPSRLSILIPSSAHSPSPPSVQIPLFPGLSTPLLIESNSSHCLFSQRIFSDSLFLSIHSFSLPSYSPISSLEKPPCVLSPVYFTCSSVEFRKNTYSSSSFPILF